MIKVHELRKKLKENNYSTTLLSEEERNLLARLDLIGKSKGRVVKHFKNKLYLIIDFAIDTVTGGEVVVYKALYGDYRLYTRPIDEFLSEVDHEKYPNVTQKYRFEVVELGKEMGTFNS